MNVTVEPENTYRSPFKGWQVSLIGLVLLACYCAGFAAGGEFGSFMQASLETVPFAVLAILAYLGATSVAGQRARGDGGRILAIGWLIGVVGLIAFLSLTNSFLAVLENPAGVQRGDPPVFIDGGLVRMSLTVLGLVVAVLVGLIGFIPAVRAWLSRYIPLDPTSFVHAIALVTVLMLIPIAFAPLLFLGEPPLLTIASGLQAAGESLLDRDTAGLQRDQVYRLLWLIPCVFFAVGYGVRRSFGEALVRLGLVRPTVKQLLLGIGLGVLLVFSVLGLELIIDRLWQLFAWPRTDGEAFGLIIEFAFSPLGAVILGITAGLGEELAVRGVLQPRLGILLSNLLFAALHALQYNWDGILIVFLIGLVFGVLRKATNTTTSAIAHGLYDFLVVMAVVLNVPGFEP